MMVEGHIDAYLHLSNEEVARLVLTLLLEDMLRQRLFAFRQDLQTQPVEGFKELGLIRGDVMPVGHSLG